MKKTVWWVCAVLLFAGCEKRDNLYLRTEVITVASAKGMSLRNGNGFYPSLMSKFSQTDQWTAYSDIEGFDYEPGYEYDLKVKVSMIDYPKGMEVCFGPSCRYELLEVTSKTKKESQGVPTGPMEHYSDGDICLGGGLFTVASEQVHDLTGSYFIVKRGENARWEVLPLPILGFEYEPGYEYVIHAFAYAKKDSQNPYDPYKYLLYQVDSQEKKDSRDLPQD